MNSSAKPAAEKREEGKPKLHRVAAFDHDDQLSQEAAEQLVQLASDPDVKAHKGKALETIS